MTKVYPTREEMIEQLVEHQIEVNFSDTSYVRDMLYGSGFQGFGDMDDESVKKEWDQLQEAWD